MVADLADGLPHAGVIALLSRCAESPGTWIIKSDVEASLGISRDPATQRALGSEQAHEAAVSGRPPGPCSRRSRWGATTTGWTTRWLSGGSTAEAHLGPTLLKGRRDHVTTSDYPPLFRGIVYRVTGTPVIANVASQHSDRFLHLATCFTMRNDPGVPVPEDEVDRLWEEAIARNQASVGLAYAWPISREVGWCPHCIVKQLPADQTPVALAAAKARAGGREPAVRPARAAPSSSMRLLRRLTARLATPPPLAPWGSPGQNQAPSNGGSGSLVSELLLLERLVATEIVSPMAAHPSLSGGLSLLSGSPERRA